MGNVRNGREARTDRKESAKDRAEEWEKLTTVQKLQQLVDKGHAHTKYAKKLRQDIVDARLKKGDV